MRKLVAIAAAAAGLGAGVAHAQGDAAAGERVFLQCRACHEIVTPDGEAIQRGGKVGPNLHGVIGRQAGSVEDFRGYSESMVAAGEKGLVWDEESFTAYVQDPTGYLRAYLEDPQARGKMAFKLNRGMEDIYAYLATFSAE